MRSRSDLRPYQDRAIEFIKAEKRCFLMLDMGMGKTASTLTAISDLHDACAVEKVLVIAPLRVASSVWPQEAQNWDHLRHIKTATVTGTERQRLAALNRDAHVYTVGKENTQWLVEHYKRRWPFDMVVIDESSCFKNRSAKRWKMLKKILPFTNYIVLLSGTPAPNNLLDLWSQIFLLDDGSRLGKTFSAFRDRFFESDYMGYSWTLRQGAADKIHAAIADKCLRLAAADYLTLPDRIDSTINVELGNKVMRDYERFQADLVTTLACGQVVEAVNAAVLAGKLTQYASGALYSDDLGNWSEIHTAKLDALSELVEACDETMLVAYNFKSDLERLLARFPDAVTMDKDPETIARWNRGEIKMLLAHPASASHGLNLQHGGALCIWFSMPWSLEHYQQFNARLHRQGQTRPVRIVHIVASDTIDERICAVLSQKDATQNSLLSALSPDER